MKGLSEEERAWDGGRNDEVSQPVSRQVIFEEHLFIRPFSFFLSSRKSKLCVQHCRRLLSCQSRVWGEQKHNQRGVGGCCHHSDSGRHKNNPYLGCSNNVFMWDLFHYILSQVKYGDYLCIVRNYSDYLCVVKNCSDYPCIVKNCSDYLCIGKICHLPGYCSPGFVIIN